MKKKKIKNNTYTNCVLEGNNPNSDRNKNSKFDVPYIYILIFRKVIEIFKLFIENKRHVTHIIFMIF